MPVSQVHRFLHGRTPQTEPHNIWILSGYTQDLLYYNIYHGCVGIRRTLELWAHENGMALTVFMDHNGTLDFSGNPDMAEAERRFNGAQPQRALPGGITPRQPRAAGNTAPTPAANAQPAGNAPEQQQETATRAQREAERAQQAAGGQGQGIQNTFTKVTHLLSNNDVPALVIVEDLPAFLHALQLNTQNVPLAASLLNTLRRDWHGKISHASVLVFLTHTPQGLEYMRSEVFPDPYRKTTYIELHGPKESEIEAALERLSLRHGFRLRGASAIASNLTRHNYLTVAVAEIKRAVNAGNSEITLEDVLHLPPINETEVERIKQEIDALVGLDEVKIKLRRLESHARNIRARLERGDSAMPEETLHMVFTGRPGTGKTTVARLVGRFMHALGVLPRDTFREVIASTLISQYTGETMRNMQQALEEALRGVLFLDEAHQLGNRENSKAAEAIQALVPMAWNHRQEQIIILAGYGMQEFFLMDPGLERRFPKHGRIHFPDYSPEQLWIIMERKLRAQGYALAPDAQERARRGVAPPPRRSTFGNAGGVDNLVSEIVQRHGAGPDRASMTLTLDDLPPLIRQDLPVYERAMAELNGLVGLGPIRTLIQGIVDKARYDMVEVEAGRGTGEISLHPGNMLFVGPPGTGKTTVGRLIAEILYGIGCIEKADCLIATSADMIAPYIGQTAPLVREVVERARDGVLFIDEAYSLSQPGSSGSFGAEAIAELIAQITNPDNEGTVFVLAGYEPAMIQFLRQNDGLARRFPNIVRFPNFAPQDCMVLARQYLERERFTWEEGVLEEVGRHAAEAARAQGEQFGNAGWVNNFLSGCLSRMRSRVLRSNLASEDLNRRRVLRIDLTAEDSGASATPAQRELVRFIADNWRPHPGAVSLQSQEPELATMTLEQVGAYVADRAFLIAVEVAEGEGHGTGFFVTPDGMMVTSAHVVAGASRLQALCGLNRAPCDCRVIARDDNVDLALVAVQTPTPTAYLPLGDSYAAARLHEVIVCGNAHVQPGEPSRVVQARISRNDVNNPRDIETDGAIEPGFSGGPVFDRAQGAVIGVVKGGYGASATLMVRAEQVRHLLAEIGYQFNEISPDVSQGTNTGATRDEREGQE